MVPQDLGAPGQRASQLAALPPWFAGYDCDGWRQSRPFIEVEPCPDALWPWFQGKNQETEMSKSIKLFTLASLLAAVAACGSKEEEFVVVEPEPISVEPTYNGKYK